MPGQNLLVFAGVKEGAKLNFDLHRCGGVWVWGILLYSGRYRHINESQAGDHASACLFVFFAYAYQPVYPGTQFPQIGPIAPIVSRQAVQKRAASEAKTLGWSMATSGGIFFIHPSLVFTCNVLRTKDEHGERGRENPPHCFSKGGMAHLQAQTYRAREARATFSCRHSFLCIPAGFLGVGAAS